MADILSLQRGLRPLLTPWGRLYGGGMALREWAYAHGWLRSWRPPVPTVSVGNIGWGGSGKTPLAGWLLRWADLCGVPVALLTRGYRARPGHYPYAVHPDAPAEEAGDEPLLLARSNPKAAVLVDPVRRRAGALAVGKFRARLLVLDDGFQHLAMRRDLNLCLLTPADLVAGWGRVCPAGTWREGPRALRRADAFLVKCDGPCFRDLADRVRERLGAYGRPVFSMDLRPMAVRNLVTGGLLQDLGGLPYLLATGVADGRQVAAAAGRFLGQEPLIRVAYPDHHFFTRLDVEDLLARARKAGCRYIVCTAKDAVKLGALATANFYCLETVVAFGPSLGAPRPFPLWWADRYAEMNAGVPVCSRIEGLDWTEPPSEASDCFSSFDSFPITSTESDAEAGAGAKDATGRNKESHGQETETPY